MSFDPFEDIFSPDNHDVVPTPKSVVLADQLLHKLEKLWGKRDAMDLEVRYQVGRLLKDKLGNRKLRQPYGKGIFTKIAERLGTSRSELTRLRQFAEKFPSLDEFKAKHADASTWKKVKELLPARASTKKAASSGSETGAATVTGRALVKQLVRTLEKATGLSSKVEKLESQDLLTIQQALKALGAEAKRLMSLLVVTDGKEAVA